MWNQLCRTCLQGQSQTTNTANMSRCTLHTPRCRNDPCQIHSLTSEVCNVHLEDTDASTMFNAVYIACYRCAMKL